MKALLVAINGEIFRHLVESNPFPKTRKYFVASEFKAVNN